MNTSANISNILDMICKREDINILDISKATGIPNPCLYRWSHGEFVPRLSSLMKLFEKFPYAKRLFMKGI